MRQYEERFYSVVPASLHQLAGSVKELCEGNDERNKQLKRIADALEMQNWKNGGPVSKGFAEEWLSDELTEEQRKEQTQK